MNSHITRQLRKDLTIWERKLWQVIKNRGVKNAKFRRQLKIGNYIVDFCCLEAKLVLEVDGGHHNDPKNKKADQIRQEYLEAQGFTVLRFWNNEVEDNLEGVTVRIMEQL